MGGFTPTLDSWLCEYFAFWQSDYKTTKQPNYQTTQQLLSTRRGDLWVARVCVLARGPRRYGGRDGLFDL